MTAPVILLPREVRLVVERVLLLTSLPVGAVPAVRDAVLYSAAAGLGGLALLRERFEAIRAPDLSAIRVAEPVPGRIVVEAGDQHAWMALPAIMDAIGEAVARHGAAAVEVTGVRDAGELRAACALGARAGLSVFAAGGPCAGPAAGPDAALIRAEAPVVLLAAPAGVAEDPVLRRALRDGLAVEPELWWALHHLSNESLSRDTPESRRHAGPVIVEADGRVIGRKDLDDETDLSLLTHPKSPEAA